MTTHDRFSQGVGFAAARGAWVAALALGCARPAAESPPAAAGAAAGGTVFTDTALFRRTCVEADSGLTPAVGRCTPRDQGHYHERRPPGRPPGGALPR
jgi:hypothetical protein